MERPSRVLLAEGMYFVRAGLRCVLEAKADIHVIGEATSGEGAVALATELRPNVAVMDLRLPGLNALAALRRLRSNPALLGVVIVAESERREELFRALRSGAKGFLRLDAEPDEFVHAVRVVARGGAHLSPWAAQRLLEDLAPRLDAPSTLSEHFTELTGREADLVLLAARGLSNREIAERLVISPATVKTHISRAMTKLHARHRAKLVALAYQSGFVDDHRPVEARVGRRPFDSPQRR
jgi:DNA-binding NarL/FixJ family response regulator